MITYNDKNSIILDFFSGSATTAHAVMNLNAEDGGNRKHIMVQLPEPTDEKSEAYKAGYKTICEIGKERIRRAGDKIVSELKEKQTGQKSLKDNEETVNPDDLDIGFKVFKLDSSNLKKWNPDYDNLENTLDNMTLNILEKRTEEDLLYEIMLKFGIDLTLPIEAEQINGKTVYNIGMGALFICLDKQITTDVANFIASKKKEINPEVTRVVFRDNGFGKDADKTNIIHILKHSGIEEIMSV
jgi:adenine-specific DNA-methyltransferase